MANLNRTQLIGRLGDNPDIRFNHNNICIANFQIATNESFKRGTETIESTTWHRCVAYRKLAEIIQQYGAKGQLVFVEGRNNNRSYEDKEGITRYVHEVIIDTFQILERKGTRSATNSADDTENTQESRRVNATDIDDDDLPF